ncbi:MAG: type VI secretion system contractile sheath large subunit [Candidatus Eisenbacteria bacterium]
MSTMPWRILVISDLGVDSGEPAPVTADSLRGWLDSLGLPVALAQLDPAGFLAGGLSGPALDAFLHDPRQQRLEAVALGLRRVLAEADGAVTVEVMSLSRKTLVDGFRTRVHTRELATAEPVTLVVLDFDFSHKAEDLAALKALAAMAAELQAPIVANAGAGFFELRFLVQAGAVKDIAGRLQSPAHNGWQAFQKEEDARWLCLTLNRFLLRAPHELEGYRETCGESNPDSYLWGRGVWLVAAAVARSVKGNGHALDLSGSGGQFGDVATRPFPINANETRALAAEVPFPDTQALELTHAAFTPVTGALGRSHVMLPMVVTTHRHAPGKLTVEGTLAYQITAARVALACGTAAGAVDGGADDAAVAARVRGVLSEQLGGLLGDQPEALAVQVLPADEQAPRRVAVTVKPPLVLETKSPVFAMEFAIG